MKTLKCDKCNGTGRIIDDRKMGQEMRVRRTRKGVSLHRLAREMGISVAYLSDLELGRRHWHDNIRSHFMAALGDL